MGDLGCFLFRGTLQSNWIIFIFFKGPAQWVVLTIIWTWFLKSKTLFFTVFGNRGRVCYLLSLLVIGIFHVLHFPHLAFRRQSSWNNMLTFVSDNLLTITLFISIMQDHSVGAFPITVPSWLGLSGLLTHTYVPASSGFSSLALCHGWWVSHSWSFLYSSNL